MSQRGPASHAASRGPSRSPAGRDGGSPRRHLPLPGTSDGRPEQGVVSGAEGFGRPQPAKALGVHNILNPSDSRHGAPDDAGRSSREVAVGPMMPVARSFGTPRPLFPFAAVHGSHAGAPMGGMSPLARPASSGRNSPVMAYPYAPPNDPRKTASPKLPRTSSFSQPNAAREMDARRASLLGASSPAKRSYEAEPVEDQRQLPGLHHSTGTTLPTSHALVTPPSTMAQPTGRAADSPYAPTPAMIARDPHGRPQSLPAHPHYQQAGALGRPMSSMGVSEEGTCWTDMMRRSAVGSGMGPAEGQQAFMTLPGSDTPIPVQVDYSQASKKADEKRQRNAKASTRHRRKKKTMQEENMRLLQDLKDERQQMAMEVDDVKRQRDFYREERNRLRDIVARTPGIHQHAAGPPSPPLRSTERLGDRSPGTHSHMPTPTPGYSSDQSSAERPAQRRRTEDRPPEYPGPMFGAAGGGPPAAMVPGPGGRQLYGVPPRPLSASSSASGERLPPLRAMDGPAPTQGVVGGVPQEQDPRTGQWRPAHPRHYETGWATAPRKPHEGHPAPWQ